MILNDHYSKFSLSDVLLSPGQKYVLAATKVLHYDSREPLIPIRIHPHSDMPQKPREIPRVETYSLQEKSVHHA